MNAGTADHRMAGDGPPFFPFGWEEGHVPVDNWGWFALRGALAVAIGMAALLLPGPALFAFATVFAAFSFADGLLSLITGIMGARRNEERWWALILSGLLGIGIGVVFFFFPVLGTVAYTITAGVLIAAWAATTGVLQIVAAYRLRKHIEGEWLLMLAGALSVLFGGFLVFLMFSAPALSMLSVATVIGIYAVAAGVALLALAFRLRRHAKAMGR